MNGKNSKKGMQKFEKQNKILILTQCSVVTAV